MKLFIVMLTYGDIAITKQCVASFCEIDPFFTKIIVVNNNIEEITSAEFGKYKRKIDVINNHKNLGFAGGVNKGIEHSLAMSAEYILLVNNDTVITSPIIKKLVSFGQKNEKAGIIAPSIRFSKHNKTLFDLGGNVNLFFGRTNHTEVSTVMNSSPREVTYVSGCCMLIKAKVCTSIGLLDESFFLYYEDVDYCLRARSNGYLSYVLPTISITHALSKTIGKITPVALYHQTRSALIFGSKYCKRTYFLNLSFVIAQCLLFTLKDTNTSRYAWHAFTDYLLKTTRQSM